MIECAEFEYELDESDEKKGPVLVLRVPLNQNRNRPSMRGAVFLLASAKGRKYIVDRNGKEREEYFTFFLMRDRKKDDDGETYED